MNKIKNIFRTVILRLSLVLMPVEGWAYVKGTTPLELQWSNYIKDKYNYACFYFEKDGTKLDISSWNILNDNNFTNSISSYDYDYYGH